MLKKLIDVIALSMLAVFTASLISGCDMSVGWDGENGSVVVERKISVNVTDQDENPLQGVRMEVYNTSNEFIGKEAITGFNGIAVVSVPEGDYKIRTTYQQFEKETGTISVAT